MTDGSHRERSKARRRTLIRLAGLDLFTRQGYVATTLADIAVAAGVSPRTVSHYYPSKLEIATANVTESAARLAAALENRDHGTPFTTVLERWREAETLTSDNEQRRLEAAMFAANPTLPPIGADELNRVLRATQRALAEDLGLSPDHATAQTLGRAVVGVLAAFDWNLTDQVHSTTIEFLTGAINAVHAS